MTRLKRTPLLFAAAPIALLAACGNAEADNEAQAADTVAATDEAQLSGSDDGNWINLSGTVVSTAPTSFVLDYGADQVTVEMDDWDFYREGAALDEGDEVIVSGRVDDDLWLNKRIEASSVYAKDLNTYFYASGTDEEEVAASTVYVTTAPSYVDSTGFVTSVEGREFTMGALTGAIRVDTTQMDENPLDDSGFQQIDVGDRVYVWGDMDLDAREKTELMARGIVSLTADGGAES